MKKYNKSNKTFFFIISILTLFLILIIPLFLIKFLPASGLLNRIINKQHLNLEINKAEWKWFPFPQIQIGDIKYKDNNTEFYAQKGSVRPSFLSLINFTVTSDINLSNVNLVYTPDINDNKDKNNDKNKLSWLNRLNINDGNITIITDKIKDKIYNIDNLHFNNVNLNLDIDMHEIILKTTSKSNLWEYAKINAVYETNTNNYLFNIETKHLSIDLLNNIIPKEENLSVTKSDINGNIIIKGNELNNIDFKIAGKDSAVGFFKDNEEKILKLKQYNLEFIKAARDYQVKINEMDVSEPSMTLSGYVNRTYIPDAYPKWDADIKSENLDAGALRDYINLIFKGYDEPERIFKRLKSGTALTAHYSYHAQSKYPSKTKHIFFEGFLEKGEVYMPTINFSIDEVSGNIILSDGVLYIEKIEAKKGNNKGYDGDLLISVDETDQFKLDIFLEAEPDSIKDILNQVFEKKHIKDEIQRFSNMNGVVKGRLILGDSLEHIKPDIRIDDINAKLSYSRLPWDISLKHAKVNITNDFVRFSQVNANLDNNKILNLKGAVGLDDNYTMIIDELDANLDANATFIKLKNYEYFSKKLQPALNNISGDLKINNLSIKGMFFDPEKWKYNGNLELNNIIFLSDLFFSETKIEKGNLTLNQDEIKISSLDFIPLNDNNKLNLKGKLDNPIHNELKNYELTFTGNTGLNAYNWIKSKDIIDNMFMPKFPCKLDNFRIKSAQKLFSVEGTIKTPENQDNIQTYINMDRSDTSLSIHNLSIKKNNKPLSNMKFKVFFNKNYETHFNFNGALNKETVDEILMENKILLGQISGDFDLIYNPDNFKENRLNGNIMVESLFWTFGTDKPFFIKQLKADGRDKRCDLHDVKLLLNEEEILFDGKLDVKDNATDMSGTVKSVKLSEKNLDYFFGDEDGNNTSIIEKWKINGEFDYAINEYEITKKKTDNNKEDSNSTLLIKDVSGKYFIYPEKKSLTEIKKGNLCGLLLDGTIKKHDKEKNEYFNLISSANTTVLFQEFLPCMGFKAGELEGRFIMNLNLSRKNNSWVSGHLSLNSENGKIQKMTLLSKILTIVNITYLLENLQDIFSSGFSYNSMEISGTIKDDRFFVDKTILKGSGLNMFANGNINLKNMEADLIVLVTPFKTVDAIISNIPIIGKLVTGEHGAVMSYPMGVKGKLSDPEINTVPPESVGEALMTIVTETLRLPFRIFSPIFKNGKNGKHDDKPTNDRQPQ